MPDLGGQTTFPGTCRCVQRAAILRAVGSARSHPDVDAVYRAVSREYPTISRDTVYRTLAMIGRNY